MKLTPATGSQSGSFVIDELAPGKVVSGFTATFNIRIADGTAEPADGFSLNFATDIPNAATGSTPADEGIGTGLSICIDNYKFTGAANTAGMKVKWQQTNILAQQQTPVWTSTSYVPVSITLTPDGQLNVIVNGTNVFVSITLTNYVPFAGGRFGLFARTGGQYETHWIDDLNITVITETTGSGGTVVVDNGNVIYTPPQNGVGRDVFYYVASDGQENGIGLSQVAIDISSLSVIEETPTLLTLCNMDIWRGDISYEIVTPTKGKAYRMVLYITLGTLLGEDSLHTV